MTKLLLLLGMFFSLLLPATAADVNATLLHGDKKIYSGLLVTLSKETNASIEVQLQRSLLEMLLAKPKKRPEPKVYAMPKDSEAYRERFTAFVTDSMAVAEHRKELKKNSENIAIVKTEIGKLGDNDPKLLSMQLQNVLYHRRVAYLQATISALESEMKQLSQLLDSALARIEIDTAKVTASLQKEKAMAAKLFFDINELKIRKEQGALIALTKEVGSIDQRVGKLEEIYTAVLKETASLHFMLFAEALKRKSHAAFSLEKQIIETLSQIPENVHAEERVEALLERMEKSHLGQIATLEGAGEQEFREILSQGWAYVNHPIFTINKTPVSIFKLMLALFALVFGVLLGGFYKERINNLKMSKRSLTTSTRTILANIGYYVILIIAFFIGLNIMGITLSSLALVAGALSVGIGFGLKNIVSNLVSGLILMFERSIKIGDFVEINGELRGHVTDIRMRSTTINTNDNIDVVIPNQNFIENNVVNWTMKDDLRRFHVPFGVKYGTDPYKVIDVVTKAVRESEYRSEIHDSGDRRVQVIMTGMGNSSVNFELLVWIKGIKMQRPKRTASRFLIIIYNTLYEHGIEIPFPQRDLHIRSVDEGVSFVNIIREEEDGSTSKREHDG